MHSCVCTLYPIITAMNVLLAPPTQCRLRGVSQMKNRFCTILFSCIAICFRKCLQYTGTHLTYDCACYSSSLGYQTLAKGLVPQTTTTHDNQLLSADNSYSNSVSKTTKLHLDLFVRNQKYYTIWQTPGTGTRAVILKLIPFKYVLTIYWWQQSNWPPFFKLFKRGTAMTWWHSFF